VDSSGLVNVTSGFERGFVNVMCGVTRHINTFKSHDDVVQCAAVCYSVLQCVAVCCSVLHNMLQCVAVFPSRQDQVSKELQLQM